MEWSNARILRFIDIYKSKPILWDPNNPMYYNKKEKNAAWEDIAKATKIHVDECKKKMTSLLASLRREKMKTARRNRLGDGEEYKSGWFAYNAMSFLLNRKKSLKMFSCSVSSA